MDAQRRPGKTKLRQSAAFPARCLSFLPTGSASRPQEDALRTFGPVCCCQRSLELDIVPVARDLGSIVFAEIERVDWIRGVDRPKDRDGDGYQQLARAKLARLLVGLVT